MRFDRGVGDVVLFVWAVHGCPFAVWFSCYRQIARKELCKIVGRGACREKRAVRVGPDGRECEIGTS